MRLVQEGCLYNNREVRVEERRYRVYLAHDANELPELAIRASSELIKHKCLPLGVGLSPSAFNDQWKVVKAMIDEADVVLLMLGTCYGELSPSGVSYVHMAYIYASTQGKLIIPLCQKKAKFHDIHLTELHKLIASYKIRWWSDEKQQLTELLSIIRQIRNLSTMGLDLADRSTGALPAVASSSNANKKTAEHVVKPMMEAIDSAPLLLENERLKQEVKKLQAQLASSSSVPAAASNLPDLDSSVTLTYAAKVFSGGNFRAVNDEWTMSWDEVFLAAAPHMLSPISEEKMRLVISAALATKVQEPLKRKYPNGHAVADVRLTSDAMHRIKIHLRSHSLIKEALHGRDIKWRLTEQGDSYLTKLYSQAPNKQPANSF